MENNSDEIIKINTLINAIDSLETAERVLDRKEALKWKWFVFAIHHSLYQFCCKSLHNANYTTLLKHSHQTDKGILLQKEDSNYWLKSRKKKIRDDHPAYIIEWRKTDDKPPANSKLRNEQKKKNKDEKLIGFWSVLARVQDPIYWMGRYSSSKSITLSEAEWDNVIWLNELRNELQHFIPKTLILVEEDFIEPGMAAINIIERLVFETYTIHCPKKYKYQIQDSLKSLRKNINA